jgi:phosphatidylserine/phosphatidylglycerophosphate/cardiolipin synthase-like enzyme
MTQTIPVFGNQFPKKVIPLIEESKNSIKIIVFDWRWYITDPANPVSLFNQALIRASRRGVKIQVISNASDVVKILNSEKIEAKKLTSKDLVHAKMMIIDEKVLVVGSHNYTQAAFTTNHEISSIIFDDEQIGEYIKFFNNLWQL